LSKPDADNQSHPRIRAQGLRVWRRAPIAGPAEGCVSPGVVEACLRDL